MNNSEAIFGASQKRFRMPICQKSLTTELSNDFILPDYLGEIRKVLRISAEISPPAKYIGGTTAELNGNLEYTLLYVGTDGELYSASLPAEYAFTIPLELTGDFDVSEGIVLLATTIPETLTTRIIAPRKLNVKCRLSSNAEGYGMFVFDERTSGDTDPLALVRLDSECAYTDIISESCDSIELSGRIERATDTLRAVSTSATPKILETNHSEGMLSIRGELSVSILLSDGGSAETLIETIPFEEDIEIEGILPSSTYKASCAVINLSLEVNDTGIDINAELSPEVTVYTPLKMRYTKDAYSTANNTECAYKTLGIPSDSILKSGNFSQSERIPLSETVIPKGSRLVNAKCDANAEKAEIEGDKLYVSGQCRYFFITETEGEYTSAELSLPFKYQYPFEASPNAEYTANVSAVDVKAKVDGANLALDCELSVTLRRRIYENAEFLSEVRFGSEIEKSSGDLIVCFPTKDDTPWSVSKRYQVPLTSVSGINSPTDTLASTPYILINS